MDIKTNIIVLATYWNERDWIEASLAQIDAINPVEVIICDGCFDPKIENRSTDGTREIIEAWVAQRPHAQIVSALRLSRTRGLLKIFGPGLTLRNLPLRFAMAYFNRHTNVYRINQAATFNEMARTAKHWSLRSWFMTLDADQFYSNETIGHFKTICNDPHSETELLTATEKTFFENFDTYTDEYEKRNYNNMPHRIRKDTLIVPTRDILTEQYPRPKVYGKDPNIKKENVGSYFHYKFRPHDKAREQASYALGDRKRPDTKKYDMKPFSGEHPATVQKIARS